jgi:hypothetical protein
MGSVPVHIQSEYSAAVEQQVQKLDDFVAANRHPDSWVILTAHYERFGMKNQAYEQIQVRKVKARLRMLSALTRLF